MFISRQDEKFVLIDFTLALSHAREIIYFYNVARLESDLVNQCATGAA